jgi:hypothetical protein
VYEEPIELRDPRTDGTTQVRRITLRLQTATRDGDQEIHVLTNLPSKVSAVRVAALYRQRWTLEQAFNELTTHLRCELNTLGYPKAALFSFCVAASSYNVLAALKGVLRGVHGEEKVDREVSNFCLTNEIQSVYGGMMVALPPKKWEKFQKMSMAKLAVHLRQWGSGADLSRYAKHPRGPKKPKGKLPSARAKHVATSKLLEQQRLSKKPKKRQTNTRPKPP